MGTPFALICSYKLQTLYTRVSSYYYQSMTIKASIFNDENVSN